MIQADIVYLPYMFTEDDRRFGVIEEDIHFGWHTLNLVGYNSTDQVALLSDNTQPELVEIPITQLKKARSSQEGWKATRHRRPAGRKYGAQENPCTLW